MFGLGSKIRKLFTRKSNTINETNDAVKGQKNSFDEFEIKERKQQPVGKNGGVISKATVKRINQSSLSRNSSLSSVHSKSEVSLVRYSRFSSINNSTSAVNSNNIEIEKLPPPNFGDFTSTPKQLQRPKRQVQREKPIEDTPSRCNGKLFIIPKSTTSSAAFPAKKNDYATKSSTDKTKTSRNTLENRSLKKPKSFPDLSSKSTSAKKSSSTNFSNSNNDKNNNNNNNIKAINRNLLRPKRTQAIIDAKQKTVATGRSLDSLRPLRGQGPSGSKSSSAAASHQITPSVNQQQQHQPLKTSSSVSSLDGIVGSGNNASIKTSSKSSSKNHQIHGGSKDKLDQNNFRNSKDKLIDRGSSKERYNDTDNIPTINVTNVTTGNGEPVILPKIKKKNSNQMPIIQQHSNNAAVHVNNNLIDQRDVVVNDYHQTNDKNITRDLTDINVDETREANRQQQSMMQELQSHLERLTREKMALEAKIVELSSYQNEVVQLRNEITRLQNIQEKSNSEIQKLTDENETLRNRLRDVVNSPLSDAEKHQIIQDSQRLHSSAPASIALPNNHEADGTPCATPDWDKHSSSSEISVACLQDKIIQMEETHYSTNEELQATLQELADLQSQLTELQTDNERLAEEKDVLFQSLCRQTEKLEDSRTQIGTLQELLLRESNNQESGTTEREQKLLDLLKNAQEERESLLIKQEELNSELNELRQAIEISTTENARLRERISLLDSTVDATNAERKQIESQLNQAKEESSEKQIEISRLTTLLENARAKIDEFEQDRAMGDKTDLGELLDSARKEKDILESQVASLQEQVSKSQCEIQKLKDQLAGITEECKVARNNAKCALSDLEYKYETLKEEKMKLSMEYQQLQDSTNELQVQCKCHLEDKSQLESLLSETQRHLGEAERLLAEKEERLQEEIKLRKQEAEEWEQFQSDLLMTVRVANDFKTEAQSAREQLVMDNKAQREKIRSLEQQIEKLNKQVSSDAQQSLLTTVQQEMAARRQKVGNISRQDSRLSVKSLIESIENVNKQTKSTGPGSRCSSSSSLNSLTSDVLNGTQNGINRSSTGEWVENGIQHQLHTPIVTGLQAKSPLREQQQTAGTNISLNGSQKSLISDFGKKTSALYANNNNNNNNNNYYYSTITSTSTTTSPTTNSMGTINNSNCNINNHNNNMNMNLNNTTNNFHHFHGKICKQTTDDTYVASILSQKQMDFVRRNSYGDLSERKDPLNALVKNGGSKRNALLKWCQNKTVGYRNIDITNFSSSWNDGLAFCAILHSYLPDRVPYDTLGPNNKRRNFSIAFSAAESVGIPTTLNINDMCQQERPDWTQVMAYVTAIYKHFET